MSIPPIEDGTKPTVLIVDGTTSFADREAARLEHCNTRTAYGGEEVLQQLDSEVDVVLLNRRIPELSDDDVLGLIHDRDLDCRVVVLTDVEPSADIVSTRFDEYVQRPVSRTELRETVERMVRRSTYDSKLQEYFSLASRRATLRAECTPEELGSMPEYDHLGERLEAVRETLDELLSELPTEDSYVVATEAPLCSTSSS